MTEKVLRVVLGDQLNLSISALEGIKAAYDTVIMAEVREEATYVKHHKKKIVFLFSAMRHFARLLEQEKFNVCYVAYDDESNKGSLFEQVKHQLRQEEYSKIVLTMPGEYRLLEEVKSWSDKFSLPVDIRPDNRFIADDGFFANWAKGKKQLRMEFFYREMRKRTGFLMEGDHPVGGKWNYDEQNRSPLPAQTSIPKPTHCVVDDITHDVIRLVEKYFPDHFGDILPFHYAVTREQALDVLDEFIEKRLVNFGQYQDAMAQNQPWLFHSHISFYLNCGLLHPEEVIARAEEAYYNDNAPLNSVEGFIRQVLGWREYVRGFYWYFMPALSTENVLQAKRKLPDFFWSGQTNMNCLRQCITETKQNAYAHHIQRLMVLGNFALLAGLSPKAVNEWYLIVYADAYEWVELPNVSAMILYADGGKLASKPYAASGSYINKMSDYCKKCGYSVSKKTGEKACPFNYLYWDFIDRNLEALGNNPRMNMTLNTYKKMSEEKLTLIRESASAFLHKIDNAQEV
ncbi:cryptochrome/photolyase family protein [Alteromonas sediminis]|uniref:Cryptochrome/photolyase family protein n=1 Tax=Alteromonas sediminis TaxID=2259342 RepID=A0A3N5Y182_9ALTE|nr:cryptochrome/photolyase family protein [Alteromonas sediminis]RPJ67352.1 cryptochrome/photolyase family protein [Alteromonas sediminis]